MAPYRPRTVGSVVDVEDAEQLAVVKSSIGERHTRDDEQLRSVSAGEGKTQTVPVTLDLDLVARDDFDGGNSKGSTRTVPAGQGAVPPDHFNNAGMLALFAILGAAFVITAIWFFFWAKDGGFVWTEHDWEDYKSTVLRRKDADGRTLTNATPSTNLGGGSIVRGEGYYYDEDDESRWPGQTDTELSRQSRMKGKLLAAKDRIFRRRNNDDDSDVRAYRNEKPARVGGINTESEATYSNTGYDSTLDPRGGRTEQTLSQVETNPTDSELTGYTDDHHGRQPHRNATGYSFVPGDDEVLSSIPEDHSLRGNRHKSRRHQGGAQYSAITEDYSHDPRISRSSQRRRDRESSRPRSQARPSQSQSRPRHGRSQSRNARSHSRHARSRRRYDEPSESSGGYTEPLDFSSAGGSSEYDYSRVRMNSDLESDGRDYHHPIPGLSKGYRRGRRGARSRRRDSLSESENELVY